jgi:hypothetical protein
MCSDDLARWLIPPAFNRVQQLLACGPPAKRLPLAAFDALDRQAEPHISLRSPRVLIEVLDDRHLCTTEPLLGRRLDFEIGDSHTLPRLIRLLLLDLVQQMLLVEHLS